MSSNLIELPQTVEGWADVLEFKPVEKESANVGLCRFRNDVRGAAIKLVSRTDAPIEAYACDPPFECTTIDQFLGTGKGQLGLRIVPDARVWQGLRALDQYTDTFMIKNAAKLFSATEADFIAKDPKAIALKHGKPLARLVDGAPDLTHAVRLRIYHRGGEVDSFVVRPGKDGKDYVERIQYRDASDPLASAATRFAMLKRFDDKGRPVVCTEIAGTKGKRPVGPADFLGGRLVSANIVVSHWAIVQGSISVCIKLVDCIFQNVARVMDVPEGFVLDNDEEPADAVVQVGAKRGRTEVAPALFPAPDFYQESQAQQSRLPPLDAPDEQ